MVDGKEGVPPQIRLGSRGPVHLGSDMIHFFFFGAKSVEMQHYRISHRGVTTDDTTAHMIQCGCVFWRSGTIKEARVEGHPPCFLAKYYLSPNLYGHTRTHARTHAHTRTDTEIEGERVESYVLLTCC